MAEQTDKEAKTEEASPRRIEDARQKGNTPFSREIGTVASLLAFGLMLPFAASHGVEHSLPALAIVLDKAPEFRVESSHTVVALIWWIGAIGALALARLLSGLVVAGLLSTGLQNPPSLVWHRIKPEASRVSPSKGLTRIFGTQGRLDFAKALFKTAVVALVFYQSVKSGWERVRASLLVDHREIPHIVITEIAGVFVAIALCMALLAALDLIWSRQKWRADLRMARHEVKEEQKQAEGDPMARARQRTLARNLARRRMIAAVPRATLIIANPTHYAVAMRYVHGESTTPIVVAKGVDHLALKMRQIAEANDMPVVEDPALARSLYAAVSTDRPIPPEFYRAIAEIILFVISKQPRAAAPPAVAS